MNAYLGRPGIPEQFDVVLFEADATADQAIVNYLINGCSGGFSGLSASEMPGGINELHRITVCTGEGPDECHDPDP